MDLLFIIISVGICEELIKYYIEGNVNLRISPHNILIDSNTGCVSISDKIFQSVEEFYESGGIESVGSESIPYISPEMGGMMNRGVDYRSDFYSIGAIFYEMLTYKQPFEVEDALELLYSHTAKIAVSPSSMIKSVPKQISDIVMKLLSKNPEERYKTSWGIKHDLIKCYDEFLSKGEVTEFALGERDVDARFVIGEKDYGRNSEIEKIVECYDRAAEGKFEVLIVTGETGMGKSWVIEKSKQIIVSRGGYFITGKSAENKMRTPYEALLQALRELVLKTLSESKSELEKIRFDLMEVMGSNIQIMTDFIPELKYITENKNECYEYTTRESEYRFDMLFNMFIKVFSRKIIL